MNEATLQHVHIRVQRDGTLYVKTGPAFGIELEAAPAWVRMLVKLGVVKESTLNHGALAEDLSLVLRQLGHTVTIEVLT